MLNIVVPMAGAGSRFAAAGFTDPKPLIPVKGVPMIRLVIDDLTPSAPHRFIFIAQRTHIAAYGLEALLSAWAPGCELIALDGVTDGAARTVLAAKHLIDSGDPLMIANSDQYVDIEIDDYLASQGDADGHIMTMSADDPKWSYARLDDGGRVTEVVEKVVVSDQATVGIYNFARGSDFVWAAERMIAEVQMVNGEYYVAPAYNELISRGATVTVHSIGRVGDGMYGLGTPADLDEFLAHSVSDRAVAGLR